MGPQCARIHRGGATARQRSRVADAPVGIEPSSRTIGSPHYHSYGAGSDYLPEQGRYIMVDVRAITEALDNVYDADRIVEELVTGRLVTSEADADESVR